MWRCMAAAKGVGGFGNLSNGHMGQGVRCDLAVAVPWQGLC